MALIAIVTQKWPFENGDQMCHKTRDGASAISTINQEPSKDDVDGHKSKEVVQRKD
jgi:hypothetical protein